MSSIPDLTPASQIKTERMRWVAKMDGQGVIPAGVGTAVAGRGGVGKSTFVLDIIARLTRGELEGDLYGQKHPAIIMGPEDNWGAVMKPRLIAAGADLNLVYRASARDVIDDDGRELRRELRFPADTQMLRSMVQYSGAKLVMVDPAPALMDGDMNSVQDVRRAYGPMVALADEHDLAAVLINHLRKGQGRAADKMSGSHAWRDLVRSYLIFAKDDGQEEVIVSQEKANYAKDVQSWRFSLESFEVTTDDGETSEVARVQHLGVSDISVDDLYQREAGESSEEDEDDRNAAQEFVVDYIEGCDGWEAKAADVIKAGTAAGFSKDEVKKARARCKDPRVASVKSAFGAGWVWQLQHPEGADDTEGATKVPKVPGPESAAPSAPSGQQVAPSPPCSLHGTDHDPESCWTCADLTGTPWSTPTTTERKAAS